MPSARRLLAAGDEDGARAVLESAGLSPQQINGVVRGAANPARGQVRMQRQFNRTATPGQQTRLQGVTGGSGGGLAAAADPMDAAADTGIAQAQAMARQAGD